MGDTPGDSPPHGTCLGRNARRWRADPRFLCLSTLDVPVAGGELAHRGTCPTLFLYLFNINYPQIQVSLIKVSPQDKKEIAAEESRPRRRVLCRVLVG